MASTPLLRPDTLSQSSPHESACCTMRMRSSRVVSFISLLLAMGPSECYADLDDHCRLGIFEDTVTGQYFPYIMPQETGNHTDARWVELRDGSRCFRVEGERFEFSALHQTIEGLDAAKHTWEIPEENRTDLLIAYKDSGIGTASCGPALDARYAFLDTAFDYSFRLTVK